MATTSCQVAIRLTPTTNNFNKVHNYFSQQIGSLSIDRYQNYSDAINANNNPLAGFKNASYNQHRLPRGAHPLDALTITRQPNGGGATDNDPISQNIGDTWVIDVSATFTEPIFLSPFLFHSKYNEAGLLGINQMNFVFNIDAQMKRFWSSGLAKIGAGGNAIPYTLSLNQADAFTNPRILLNFLTSQQTNLLPARNIVPYVDYPRYITSQQNTNVINAGNSSDIVINNIQLNQIADRFVIVARKRLSDKVTDGECQSLMAQNNHGMNLVEKHKFMTKIGLRPSLIIKKSL